MLSLFRVISFSVFALSVTFAQGQFLQSLSGFGGSGSGWLAPGDLGFNNDTTGATIRGFAYHAPSNRLIVPDRLGGLSMRLLDGNTGAQVGTLNSAGITGGFFIGNMVGVSDDGNVYMGNLSIAADSPFKIYRWNSSEVANPSGAAATVAFDGLANRPRTGDSFAVTGSGNNTRIVSAGGANTNNSFALFSTSDGGQTFSLANPTVTGAPGGAFRFGIDFDESGNVLGTQVGTALYAVSEAGGAATVYNTVDNSETIFAFYEPLNLLATLQYTNNAVRLYNAADFSNLILLDTQNLTGSFNSNGNAVGALSFGRGSDGVLRLYALNANNGIQAFSVVPEPGAAGLLALLAGLGSFVRRRQA